MSERKFWASLHPFYEGGAILGRTEANRGFIRALLRRHPFSAYHFFLPHPDDLSALEQSLRLEFPLLWEDGAFSLRLQRELPRCLSTEHYYCMHLSDPFSRYTDALCLRNAFSRRIFPITAPTHSLSYAEYGRDFLQHMWGGVTQRDALAATSRAGADVLRNYYAFLRRNYNMSQADFPAPSVYSIPLGVNPDDFPAPEEKAALGAACRKRYGLENELIFLIFARISYQSKLDPLPALRAFKRAEEAGLKAGSYCLALAGWMDNDDPFGESLKKLAANLGIKLLLAARPDAEARKALYAAADIFLSPADNLQETFGLTLLEASLSGLPVLASDFDGYKDLVDHGRTGLLLPTTGPSFSAGVDALRSICPASEYHLLLAQQCVVEVEAMSRAILRLGTDAQLRRRMGAAGRERVLASYTWDKVLERYLELWDELNSAPCALPEDAALRPLKAVRHPSGPAYMDIFGAYFTRQAADLEQAGVYLRWSAAGEAVYRGKDFPVLYRLVEDRVDTDKLKQLLFAARRPVKAAGLRSLALKLAPEGGPRDGDFLLLWALKHDFLEFVEQGEAWTKEAPA